jgi:hypothetical protein
MVQMRRIWWRDSVRCVIKIEKKEARDGDFWDVVNEYNTVVQWLNVSQN